MANDEKHSCTEFVVEILMVITAIVILISVLIGVASESRSIVFNKATKEQGVFLSSAYSLFLPLMSYLFSQAKQYNSKGKAQVILIWMVLIETIRVRRDPIITWKLRNSAEQLVRLFWVGFLVYSYTPLSGIKVSLFVICVYFAIREILKGVIFNLSKDSSLLAKNPNVIHNYMKRVLLEDNLQTTPMTSCDYIVMGEKNHEISVCHDGYRLGDKKSTSHLYFELDDDIWRDPELATIGRRENHIYPEGILTIRRVFGLNPHGGLALKNRYWRDTCLSLGLAKMLMRRFVNLPLDEANSTKALDFIQKGLIGYIGTNQDIETDRNNNQENNPDRNERVYTIIRKELKLVSEFLCMEVPIYHYYNWYLLSDVFGLAIMTCIGGSYIFTIIQNGFAWPSLEAQNAYNYCLLSVFFSNLYVVITFLLACACIYIQNTGITTAFWSKLWFNLKSVENYIKVRRRGKMNFFCCVDSIIALLFSFYQCYNKLLMVPEQEKFKKAHYQCTVLDIKAETILLVIKCNVSILMRVPKWLRRKIPRSFPSVYHSTVAKEAILNSLENHDGRLTNGNTSLTRHHMEHLKWTCLPNGSTTEAILIWHIATTLFHHRQPSILQDEDIMKKQAVALELSSYCLYLVAYLPELLPDEAEWTKDMYDSVIKEILVIDGFINQKPTNRNRCELILQDPINHPIITAVQHRWAANSVLEKGVKLAKRLGDDQTGIWTMLADFWVEMMLFIAPSDNVKAHEENLHRAELVTQLWALLTHAGILSRPKRILNLPPPWIELMHSDTGRRCFWNPDTRVMQDERPLVDPPSEAYHHNHEFHSNDHENESDEITIEVPA